MSTNVPSTRFPFNLAGKVDPQVENAIRWTFNGLTNHEQAFAALKAQLTALQTQLNSATASATAAINTLTESITSQNITVIGGLLNIGTVNDESTQIAYTLQSSDNGALIILNAPTPIALTTNSAISTPFFTIPVNFGAGTVTVSTDAGLINGLTSITLVTNQFALIFFDGTNWWAAISSVGGSGTSDFIIDGGNAAGDDTDAMLVMNMEGS